MPLSLESICWKSTIFLFKFISWINQITLFLQERKIPWNNSNIFLTSLAPLIPNLHKPCDSTVTLHGPSSSLLNQCIIFSPAWALSILPGPPTLLLCFLKHKATDVILCLTTIPGSLLLHDEMSVPLPCSLRSTPCCLPVPQTSNSCYGTTNHVGQGASFLNVTAVLDRGQETAASHNIQWSRM